MKLPFLASVLLPVVALAAPAKRPARTPEPAAPAPAAPAPAATSDLEAAVRIRIDVFFKMLKDERPDGAYAKLFEGSTLAKDNPALVRSMITSTEAMIEKCGKIESATLLKVRTAGRTLKEVTYMANCQAQPVRWQFYVYFAEGRWQILDTNVDLELSSFFDPEKPDKSRAR